MSLKGKTIKDRFKGFAIQPISFKGPNRGTRQVSFLFFHELSLNFPFVPKDSS